VNRSAVRFARRRLARAVPDAGAADRCTRSTGHSSRWSVWSGSPATRKIASRLGSRADRYEDMADEMVAANLVLGSSN
jgi:hypothetical protein